MKLVMYVTMRDSKLMRTFESVEEAGKAWDEARKDPDVAAVSGGYRVVDVSFGSNKTYTYFCDNIHRKGTRVVVPVGNSNELKVATVVRCDVRTRQQLNAKYPFDQYKSVIKRAC